MSVKKISKEQPENFEFTSTSLETANKIIKKYPKGKQQSAVWHCYIWFKVRTIIGYL